MTRHDETVEGLRAWAKGHYGFEAAVEMLVRGFDGRFAGDGYPWVAWTDEGGGHYWFDASEVELNSSGLSSGERVYVLFAAWVTGQEWGSPVDAPDLARLDRGLQALVLAGLSHAGGSHDHPVMTTHERTDSVTGEKFVASMPLRGSLAGPLFPWPHTTTTEGA